MFGGSRRRHHAAQPLTRETANPNAATAAAAVFMSRRDSNSSLSSAAAAAALRARPMTPTNVAEVQSKRVARRTSSISSLSGSVRGRRELTRTPSVGSMIERTFRTPSPGRSPAPRERVPPVPDLPSVDQIMASHHTNGVSKGSKGPTLQSQPFRTASQRLKEGQPTWFAGAVAREANPRTSDAAIYSSTHFEPRSGSVSPSINFSYPRARAMSPAPAEDDQTLVYDPNSRRMVTKNELVGRSQSFQQPAERSKKKKKKANGASSAGTHLSKGTVGGRTMLSVPESNQASDVEPDPEEESTRKDGSSAASNVAAAVDNGAKNIPKKARKKKKAVQGVAPLDSAAQRQSTQLVNEEPRASVHDEKPASVCKSQEQEISARSTGTGISSLAVESKQRPQSLNPENKRKSKVHSRVHSESPARSAHFATPSGDQLAVKHEPPSRSVSPRKSAMKLSNHARGVSPSDDGSETSFSGSPAARGNEDAALARKKSARVSWDDRNTVVVGEAAPSLATDSPVIPSPQTKKSWLVSKFGKKDSVVVAEDETMTPRPALPQFDSVREKKVKEPEERALVRPSERTFSSENGPEMRTQPVIAVGEPVAAQDLVYKNAANISKTREPLPATSSSDGKQGQMPNIETSDETDTEVTTEVEDNSEDNFTHEGGKVRPHATSAPTKMVALLSEDDDSRSGTAPQAASHASGLEASPSGNSPAEKNDASPPSQSQGDTDSDTSGMSTPTASAEPLPVGASMADIAEEDEETETDRFSDAYEDLEEVDGDGFLSLDAVVDSPAIEKVAKKKKNQDKPNPSARVTKQIVEKTVVASTADETSKSTQPDDWENAKAYWRSLSIERRRQLEIEALSEIEDDTTPGQPGPNGVASNLSATNAERLYQIKPGTRWPDMGIRGDEGPENSSDAADAAKRASIQASKQANAADTSQTKFRQTMRQSMRSDPPQSTHNTNPEEQGGMRRSMRDSASPSKARASNLRSVESHPAGTAATTVSSANSKSGMRQSMRGGQMNGEASRPALSSAGRPSSYHQHTSSALVKSHRRNISMDDLNSGLTAKPVLRRVDSDDSESSFKRKRSSSGDARHFRMSMRSSMREPMPAADPAKRFSLRSLSPSTFRRNSFSSLPPETTMSMAGGSGRMRQSLREKPASSSSRLKMGSLKKPSGFGKRSKNGSRFADSSDEEDGEPSEFQSRFADSSDDDEPASPRKSKGGLPRSLRSGNGTADNTTNGNTKFPDISDDNDDATVQPKPSPLANGQKTLRRSRSGRGTLEPLPQNDAPRPAASRRGSFMSMLRRKRDVSDKITKVQGESAARRDTNLERSPEELARLRGNSMPVADSSWPLHHDNAAAAENGRTKGVARPSTSSGPLSSKKSFFLRRRSTSQGVVGLSDYDDGVVDPVPAVPDGALEPGSQRPQQLKKKKFGALRKMFGIHD